MTTPTHTLQLRTLIRSAGELELSLVETPMAPPKADEVVVRIEAAPLNPSDLYLLFGTADLSTVKASEADGRPVITASVPQSTLKSVAGRVDRSLPVGNEGAGTVVAAGSSAEAQALIGKTVAMLGGAMYAQYRTVSAAQCLVLPEGATARDGASSFVNPITALGMVETMRREGHTAMVHTAAASNLGQMLLRICQKDGVGLVNIVRKPDQVALLREMGAAHVVDSSSSTFLSDLTDAIATTGATIGFDAIGGGRLAGQILGCMEAAANRSATEYSRYGSSTFKQVYIYGSLDRSPTELVRNFGMTWGLGGWLLFPFLQKVGAEGTARIKARVVSELKTTFASHYTGEVSFAEMLQPGNIAKYSKQATGEKVLLLPWK